MSERWVWDRYWHCDRIASCFDGAGARNYGDSIAAGWREYFAELPEQARIIDLCTGNGAIALMAAEAGKANSKGFAITAVDQADIDPPSYVTRNREEMAAIQFVGRTEVEALPFPDESFDVAISQYGLEYSNLDRAVPEMVRVLRRSGRIRLVIHAAEGVIAAGSRKVIADADLLLDAIDLIGAARRCLDAVARVERGDGSMIARQRANAAVADFKTALRLTSGHIPHAEDKIMFNNSGGVLLDAFQARGKVGHSAALAKVETVESEILAHRGRLRALVDSALDKNSVEALIEQLKEAGAIKAKWGKLENAEGLIGYVATARFA